MVNKGNRNICECFSYIILANYAVMPKPFVKKIFFANFTVKARKN